MYITVGANEYELKTKLATSIKLEQRFKLPLIEIFASLEKAEILELISILAIAGDKVNDKPFKEELTEEWDYTDLQNAVQELLTRLMFSGSAEQNEKKIDKFPVGEEQKNAFREMLGLPLREMKSTDAADVSIQSSLSE